MEVRYKIVVGAVAVGVVATGVALWRTDDPPAVAEPVAPPRPMADQTASAPDAAPAPNAEKRLPGAWVDQNPPQAAANGPLVIGLHGRGDTPGNFGQVAPKLAPRLHWRLIEAPLPWRENTQWFRMDAPDSGKADLQAAEQLVAAHVQSARGRKVGLVGFSQGCFVAAHFAATHPQDVHAVLCIGGGLVFSPEVPQSSAKPAILFVHGLQDNVVPAARSRNAKQVLENLGLPCELLEHGEAHVIPEAELGRMRGWLESKLAQ
ncbi:MAG: dienelactone hydrolase family protein [Deltaproteobacteria bacterium]|nr:dienelactone hydrolase family protein [Deltaproteobacteria bacterium]